MMSCPAGAPGERRGTSGYMGTPRCVAELPADHPLKTIYDQCPQTGVWNGLCPEHATAALREPVET